MSLNPCPIEPVPAETAHVAHAAWLCRNFSCVANVRCVAPVAGGIMLPGNRTFQPQ
jgi:hypothetical protein